MRGDVDAAATVLATLTGLARPFRSLDDELSVARAWVAAGRGTVSTAVAILLAAAERARAVGRFAVEVMCLQTATQFGNDTCARGWPNSPPSSKARAPPSPPTSRSRSVTAMRPN